ncbi:MAG: hypothetical protein AAF217_03865 [Pseudomonadota bacterium]
MAYRNRLDTIISDCQTYNKDGAASYWAGSLGLQAPASHRFYHVRPKWPDFSGNANHWGEG